MDPTPAVATTRTRLVLVAGAGRSGTSTVVGLLRALGALVPQPEVVADASNPRGFGEPRWVVDLHDRLLARAGVQVADARPDAWARVRSVADPAAAAALERWLAAQLTGSWAGSPAGSGTVVVKDPRLSWFLPLWCEAAGRLGIEPVFVTMLRPPPEVVGSRRQRYNRGLEDAHGLAGWLNLMLATERETRGSTRLLLHYHDLLRDPSGTARRLAIELALPTGTDPAGVATDAATDAATDVVDPALHRVMADWSDLSAPSRLDTLTRRAWAALAGLAELAQGQQAPGTLDELDTLRAEYDDYYRECESVARSSVLAATPAAKAGAPAPARPTRGWRRRRRDGHPQVPEL